MSIYGAAAEETLRTRQFLKDWAGEGYLAEPQYQRMEQEAASGLRTTNIFLRLVLFLFSLIIVGAAVGMFFPIFLLRPSEVATGIFFLIIAAVCYGAAEAAVSQFRLYRYGIEEALVFCSVGFLCAGVGITFSGSGILNVSHETEFLVGVAGAISSLWIWHRFGLPYAFLGAMIFAIFLPSYWTSSHSAQHLIIALFYTAGLAGVAAARTSHHFDFLDDAYSLVEAFLWVGIYLVINLQLSSLDLLSRLWSGSGASADFPKPFYWATWVLTWCLPPVMLVRGVRRKDRLVLATGAICALLTLVTNKPYLGWPRHTWDPMLLGVLLAGISITLRRWLAHGPNGIRHGVTAQRLSGRYKQWVDAGSAAISLLSPQPITPAPHPSAPQPHFGGGDSGGGGASSDF